MKRAQSDPRGLIASDVDGTLLPTPDTVLKDSFFEEIRRLKKDGILFCAASGRSYTTLRRVFEPVVDEMLFMPENGATAYQNDQCLYRIFMSEENCRELVTDIYAHPDCEVRINGVKYCYLIPKGDAVVQRTRKSIPDMLRIVQNFDEINEPITKISAFCPNGVSYPAKSLLPKWQQRLDAVITHTFWMDFTAAGKDVGMRRLCKYYGIPLDKTIAFGDNFNDMKMLEAAGNAYIMSTASPELLDRFPQHCSNVLEILKTIRP